MLERARRLRRIGRRLPPDLVAGSIGIAEKRRRHRATGRDYLGKRADLVDHRGEEGGHPGFARTTGCFDPFPREGDPHRDDAIGSEPDVPILETENAPREQSRPHHERDAESDLNGEDRAAKAASLRASARRGRQPPSKVVPPGGERRGHSDDEAEGDR